MIYVSFFVESGFSQVTDVWHSILSAPGGKETHKNPTPQPPSKADKPEREAISRADCWYYITHSIHSWLDKNEGRLLVVSDIDQTLLFKKSVGYKDYRISEMPGAASAVQWLQENPRIDLIAITDRIFLPESPHLTEEELLMFGISILRPGTEAVLSPSQASRLSKEAKVTFQNNIIYKNYDRGSKGHTLQKFMEILGVDYNLAVFVDDLFDKCIDVHSQYQDQSERPWIYHFTPCNHKICRKHPHLHEWHKKNTTEPSVTPVQLLIHQSATTPVLKTNDQ